jgi:transketolase
MKNLKDLEQKTKLVRKWSLISTTEAGSGHPTSCLSAAELGTVLFNNYLTYDLKNPLNLYNDRFVLSKGHAAPLLYALFAMSGAYPLEELKTLRKFGSPLEGHPTPKYPYAEAATGSLGQGLSVGAGLALLAKRENLPFKTYVLLGDGELAEGQNWEAANFASFNKLDNLIAIADINRLGQSQETMFGHLLEEYITRFTAFGFEAIAIDGNNLFEVDKAFKLATNNNTGKPFVIIARTYKGRGISFLENKDNWHGKPLKKEELEKALKELGEVDDGLRFQLKKPPTPAIPASLTVIPARPSVEVSPLVGKVADAPRGTGIPSSHQNIKTNETQFKKGNLHATREVYGQTITELGKLNKNIYALDAEVKNSTYSQDFLKAIPERFIECFIAEQNMIGLAVGLSRLGKIPFTSTFAAFLTRATDQIRMARIGEANLKIVGSHAGVSIGEDGPSQMALEDLSFFGAIPDSIIFHPADAVSTAKIIPHMINHTGISYLRTLRIKTPVLYNAEEEFPIGGSKILRKSTKDILSVVATGITVFETLKAYEELKKEEIYIRVIDCYSIKPIDARTLKQSLKETKEKIIITVEDHFEHGGLGDFVLSAVSDTGARVKKIAVTKIAGSGTPTQLLDSAGISSRHIIKKVKKLIK